VSNVAHMFALRAPEAHSSKCLEEPRADTVLGVGLPSALALLGGLVLLKGLIQFSIAMMQAGVFPDGRVCS
jgi:hypothetical protein